MTAIFTVTILRRPVGTKRWVSLILLTIGVAIVSLPNSGATLDDKLLFHDTSDHFFPRSVHELGQAVNPAPAVAHHLSKRSATYEGIQEDEDPFPAMNYSLGLAAVLVAATVSALNGVYFEKVLKDSPTPVSVWTRNIQLSFYSLFPAFFVGVVFKDGEEILRHGFFDGYNWVVWAAVSFHAVDGVLTALVINYADNIAKNFSTSLSILISVVFSVWFFEFELTPTVCPFSQPKTALPTTPSLLFTPSSTSPVAHKSNATQLAFGTILVIAATYIYTTTPRHPRANRPGPIHVASLEKTTIDRLGTPRPGSAAATPSLAPPVSGGVSTPSRMTLDPMDAVGAVGLSSSRPASPMFARPSTRKDWDE